MLLLWLELVVLELLLVIILLLLIRLKWLLIELILLLEVIVVITKLILLRLLVEVLVIESLKLSSLILSSCVEETVHCRSIGIIHRIKFLRLRVEIVIELLLVIFHRIKIIVLGILHPTIVLIILLLLAVW